LSNESEKQRPTHEIFVVAGDDQNARWLRVGAAFANRDGKGFNLTLDAFPSRDGRLVMREPQNKSADDGGEKKPAGKTRRTGAPAPAP
jgi:hypothetical protein